MTRSEKIFCVVIVLLVVFGEVTLRKIRDCKRSQQSEVRSQE